MDDMGPILLVVSANVPAIHGMGCPCAAFVRVFMQLNRTSGWSQKHSVVIKRAVDVSIIRHTRSCVGLAQKVQGELALR